ncbi:carboxymuconolactone decarboxylase family protein [Phaeobacter sp. QD34_3]|uniref:carboxymuconolactone decarboxylase family protein n=1 Tax=unclassified Phaeobacter TaxID=2621772 RepID=UPI00237F7FB2|nr:MULTISPECIES: carboxymuconolactone decarboxylase family protein [unclassified Phaeobacter]MDE4134885.1 carboxymuconolactone decarboxylase family protein [Phaeobacter sp. QD34_3]MDE4138519.1 carboxymuconolactone decarboxylase family protein [Phaeobacter sp. QD34_24]
MTHFPRHTAETAPDAAKDRLVASEKAFGFLPGLYQVMADVPQLLEIYQRTHEAFMNTSFNTAELTVVWQTINVEHECHYCVPAHTGIAHSMNVDADVIEALRNETPLADPKLEALRSFTLALVRGRGNVTQAESEAFYAAGYGSRQVLEIILGLSQKVLSNYTNHVAQTAVDPAFQAFAWEKADKAA